MAWWEGFDYAGAGGSTTIQACPLGTLFPSYGSAGGTVDTLYAHTTGSITSAPCASVKPVMLYSPVFATGHVWFHAWIRTIGEDARITFVKLGVSAFTLTIKDTGQVELRRGNSGGTVLATSVGAIPVGEHTIIAYVGLDNGVAGNVYVYIDKSTTPFVSITQADTTAATTASFDQVLFAGGTGAYYYIDDVGVFTEAEKQEIWGVGATAIAPPALPTNVPYEDLFMPNYVPNANVSVQWTPSAGTNYENVDETPVSTVDYNSTTNLTDTDLFSYAGLGIVPTRAWGAKVATHSAVDGTITGVANLLDLAGAQSSDATGQSRGSAGVYALRETFFTSRPGGGAWDPTAVGALRFGYIARNA